MIYMDNAATTKPCREAVEAMLPYLAGEYGNPSAMYSPARKSREALDRARDACAQLLHADSSEIYFTSGGSESDNWALSSVFYALRDRGNHIVTTAIEHPAVLNTCHFLEKMGARITYLPVDRQGRVDPENVEKAITDGTILVSVMTANNEIGTIEPIREIGKITHRHGVLFHTDAVQACGHISIDVKEDEIDFLSASGHKFHGPKGTGFLYIRKGVPVGSMLHGGSQERGRRAGTENVPGIVGMGAAALAMQTHLKEYASCEMRLRDYAIRSIEQNVEDIEILGDRKDRLPGNIDLVIDGVEGDSLLIMLDQRGICASSGSACSTGSLSPSHVLGAIGISGDRAYGALRLTLSYENTREEIDEAVAALKECVRKLRV